MQFYGSCNAAEQKSDSSPVTEADHAANQVIVSGLKANFPGDAILSEESADTAERLEARRVWIVDPLDGTKEFLAQNGEFSIMIGLVENGKPVVGVVYLPDGDMMYSAGWGMGSWLSRDGRTERLNCVPPTGSPRLIGSRSHSEPILEQICEALGTTDVQPCGSVGVKCGRIADGRRDLYVHPVPYMKEWDTCAPEVILTEAGGTVTDCNGDPLKYNKVDTRQLYGIMACAPGLKERVIPITAELFASAHAG